MRFKLNLTIEMTPEQMQVWADRHGIEATEEAITADLWGRDMGPLLDGSLGEIFSVAIPGFF